MWQPSTRYGEAGRRTSLRQGEQPRTHRPGELRLPANDTHNSLSNSAPSVSRPRAEPPRLHSASSLQSFPQRTSTLAAQGRVRSGSLGLQSQSHRPIRTLPLESLSMVLPLTELQIAVVGPTGCGKTSFIMEDAKKRSDTSVLSSSATELHPYPTYRYTRPIDWINQDEVTCIRLVVYELDMMKAKLASDVDAVFICYDASDISSLELVRGFLDEIPSGTSIVAIACKSDLASEASISRASDMFSNYNIGLVPVSLQSPEGRDKVRRGFNWLLRSRLVGSNPNNDYRNPASPLALSSPVPWERRSPASATPPAVPAPSLTDDPISPSTSPLIASRVPQVPRPAVGTEMNPFDELVDSGIGLGATPESFHTDSSDLGRLEHDLQSSSPQPSGPPVDDLVAGEEDGPSAPLKERDIRSTPYATLDELLDKLVFLSVSGDDSNFISHFLLTYRRFATPRSLLLAMQKRMRQLDAIICDPMFACYAQMRICHLLDTWMDNFPHDFAVPGAASALNAVVKSIISKTYLLHYGADFLPFLERAPGLVDKDASWSLKAETTLEEPEELYDEEEEPLATDAQSATASLSASNSDDGASSPLSSRERKPSIQVGSKTISVPSLHSQDDGDKPMSEKVMLTKLRTLAMDVLAADSNEIAEEITRIEVKLFLEIEPRDWLKYTFSSSKKDPDDLIGQFNMLSNHLADWVASLILCHDKPKQRARQIEKFLDVASKLRAHNNYSALRAFVAGINGACFEGDDTRENLRTKSPEQYKNLLSWDVLFQQRGSHHAYRLALRNTKGACIPALEIHQSDLIRAHEGNSDVHAFDPQLIHWGKYNMLGRFVQNIMHCQASCQNAKEYRYLERSKIADMIQGDRLIMSQEMQTRRIAPPDDPVEDEPGARPPATNVSSQRDITRIRRVFQHVFHA
ncbi:ras GEF [Coniophora puteana RWD-64-598 SS2]|uniref:Ras GEF n=1 Tax=Coniophora puteana (strain RWD-64-598) TaxID=741705 RepID=A0A5M3N5K1_CONPW|nr:ras GEF [Coniophora puteana RWD-64-598 SS2]EIW86690.1 ras GEF [Coniophora puteana RWD-64-598 SS2]